MERIIGFADKSEANLTALALLATATARIATLETELTALKATSADGAVTITNLTAQIATAEAATLAKASEITTLQGQLEAEKRRAEGVIAGQGLATDLIPAAALNTNAGGAQRDPIAQLRAQLEASSDPQEKFTLSVQIRELLTKTRAA